MRQVRFGSVSVMTGALLCASVGIVYAQDPVASPPPQQSVAGSSKVFNPDISVNGNFVGVGGRNPFSTRPPFQLSEVEVAFQAIVDPYARADFYLAAGPDGLEVEEGFITFNTLPGGFLLKAGKMRASFGKVNTMHTHAMPTADRPLVTENLVGGEEGISDSGLSLSKLLPNDLIFLEATGEVFAGTSAVFQSGDRTRLNYVGRLRGFRDLSNGANLDFGASVAYGPTDAGIVFVQDPPILESGPLNRRLVGVDVTFRYRPLSRAIYRRFQARTELIWNTEDRPGAVKQTAFGFYGLLEYQFAQRWYIGGRVDRSARHDNIDARDSGGSVFMTFWPSEFAQIRGQYRRTNYAERVAANEVLLQINFSIGAHGAHVF